MKKLVIDVSHHNGKVDWAKVKASGVEGVMVRVGYSGYDGEMHYDRLVRENIEGASKNGLDIGLYVYSYNRNTESAKRTADELAKFAEEYKSVINMPVAFDIEETGHDIFTRKTKAENAETCIAFCERIKEYGFYPMVYSYTFFINAYIDMSMLKDYDLWIADYRDEKGVNCPYKGNYTMWQYIGDLGRTDGVVGGCDRNWCYKDYPKIIKDDKPEVKEKTVEQFKKDLMSFIKSY